MAHAESSRVLIVEPDPSILHSFGRQLSKAGFEVTGVSEAAQALKKVEHTHFDLFISNFRLPKIDGIALLRLLRDRVPDPAFVLLLEAPDNQRAIEALELGAFQSLIKPVRPDVLERAAALALELRRKRDLSPTRSVRRFPPHSASVTATEAKNELAKLIERTTQGDVVVITKHDTPKAVLLSVDEFEALSDAPRLRIHALTAEFDSLLARMQGQSARKAMQTAFSASSKQLGETALKAVRKGV